MASFADASKLLSGGIPGGASLSGQGGSSFDPQAIIGLIRGDNVPPELDEAGNVIPPSKILTWIRHFISDIADFGFSFLDPSDAQLQQNSRFILAICCAGVVVATAQLYLTSTYAKSNSSSISPDMVSGVNTTFLIGAGVSFFNLLIWFYLLKKGEDGYDKETLQFFAILNFILIVTASGLSSLTNRVISNVVYTPSILAQYDASVVLNIRNNFNKATSTFNWMILWNGLLLVYVIFGEHIRDLLK